MTPRQIFAWLHYADADNSRRRLEAYEVVSLGSCGDEKQRKAFVDRLAADLD